MSEEKRTHQTPLITRVGMIGVPVNDQDRALKFYVDTLGFESRVDVGYGDHERWLEVAPLEATTTIALVPPHCTSGINL